MKTKEQKVKEDFIVVIRGNNTVCGNEICGICGEMDEARMGASLFLDGYPDIVCDKCGEKYAPDNFGISESI